ncbi:HesB/YadR/YfhF family protein [Alicyclobacillus acidiphilus]|uniref:HesB/YadR/YfhF family protein n=1 Tax=Alicyclobacillus acidiphilus TaxID=182455 RepID=UPI00082AB719|nr:cytoplasmic protein [Alicyclobacillus acidiphilus]
MKMHVDPRAAAWLTSVLDVPEGNAVRFTVRYGGQSNIQPGFSIGLSVEPPQRVALQDEVAGTLFFVQEDDTWYFDGRDFYVDYVDEDDGIAYRVQ